MNDPAMRGHAAAVAAAAAARRALDAASAARHSAAGVAAGISRPVSGPGAIGAIPQRRAEAMPTVAAESVCIDVSDAVTEIKRRDPLAARKALRVALAGGRTDEVAEAAAAAQKIIDSFKRSQDRRKRAARGTTAAPEDEQPTAPSPVEQATAAQRMTLNRRHNVARKKRPEVTAAPPRVSRVPAR